jgi:hypothetical protein
MCAFTGSFSNYSYSFRCVLSFKTHTRLCNVASIGEKITEYINHGLHSREKHMNTETDIEIGRHIEVGRRQCHTETRPTETRSRKEVYILD